MERSNSTTRITHAVLILGAVLLGAAATRAERLAAEAAWSFNTKG